MNPMFWCYARCAAFFMFVVGCSGEASTKPSRDVPQTDDVAVLDDVATGDDVTPVDDVAGDDSAQLMDIVAVLDVGASDRAVTSDVPVTDREVSIDRPAAVDVSRDSGPPPPPPPPPCPSAPGGSAMVRPPTMMMALRDMMTESWLGSPAIVDLDRDGSPEIVAARERRVVVWRANGTLRWGAAPGVARVWAPPVVGDFVGDANLEVAAASGDRVALYTAMGAMVAGFPVRWRDEVRSLSAGDLDGNGRPELVAASTTTQGTGAREDVLTAFRGDGTVVQGFPPNGTGTSRCDSACDIAGAFDENLAVGRLDNDAFADIVAATDNAYVSWHRGTGEAFAVAPIFRGVTRSPGVRFFTDYSNVQQGYATNEASAEQAHFTTSSPVIADIDHDGNAEIVVLGSIQNAAQTDRRRGVGLFVVRADGTRPPAWVQPFQVRQYLAGLSDFGATNVVAQTCQVAVADLDPSAPGLEMVFAGYDGRVWCVGADRSMRWNFQYTTSNTQATGGVILVDLSGDGRPEVVFASYSTQRMTSALHVLDARGVMLHRVALPGRGAMAVPAAGDLNRDGTIEIVVSLKDPTASGDEVLVFTVPGSAGNCMPWPMSHRAPLRDSAVPR